MEVKVHGFENFTIKHAQRAFDVLAQLQSKKNCVEINYIVKEKQKRN